RMGGPQRGLVLRGVRGGVQGRPTRFQASARGLRTRQGGVRGCLRGAASAELVEDPVEVDRADCELIEPDRPQATASKESLAATSSKLRNAFPLSRDSDID